METIYENLVDGEFSEKTITRILKIIFILIVVSVTLFFGYYPLLL